MMVGTSSFSPLASWLAASPTPEIVLLHVGTNDAINGVPVATRLANVKSDRHAPAAEEPEGPGHGGEDHPDRQRDPQRAADRAATTRASRRSRPEVSTATSPVTVVDLYTGYDGVADNQPDGIHPKTTGERKMAGAWQRALAPILSATPTRRPPSSRRPHRRRPRRRHGRQADRSPGNARGGELQPRRRGRRRTTTRRRRTRAARTGADAVDIEAIAAAGTRSATSATANGSSTR